MATIDTSLFPSATFKVDSGESMPVTSRLNALRESQMGDIKFRQAQQEEADNMLLRQAYNAPDPVNFLAQQGRGDLVPAVKESMYKTQEAESKLKTQRLDQETKTRAFINQGLAAITTDPSDEHVVSWANQAVSGGYLPPDVVNESLQQILSVPVAQRAAYIRNMGLSAEQQTEQYNKQQELSAPKWVERSDNQSKWYEDVNPLSSTVGQTRSKIKMGATPGQQLTYSLGQQRIKLSASKDVSADDIAVLENAANNGQIDPNKITSRTAHIFAGMLRANPNLDMATLHQNVEASGKAFNNFNSGVRSKTITALNTSMNHLDTLDQLGTALNNGNVQLFNNIANTWSKQTGQAAPTNFKLASQFVGGELMKAMVNAGVGTKDERAELAHAFDTASSPSQLQGAISTAKKLLSGQVESIGQEWVSTTKRSEDEFLSHLSPSARNMYTRTGATPPAAVGVQITAPNGKTYTFADQKSADAFKAKAGIK